MLEILLYLTAGILFFFFAYSVCISVKEKEKRASLRFSLLSVILPLPFLLAGIYGAAAVFSWILLLMFYLPLLWFFLPRLNKGKTESVVLRYKIDERDTMFSRNLLKPESREYDEYYRKHPERQKGDDALRSNPGLLSDKAAYFRSWIFGAAEANFDLIEKNRQFVDGEISGK